MSTFIEQVEHFCLGKYNCYMQLFKMGEHWALL